MKKYVFLRNSQTFAADFACLSDLKKLLVTKQNPDYVKLTAFKYPSNKIDRIETDPVSFQSWTGSLAIYWAVNYT